MKKIHMEIVNETIVKKQETVIVPKQYFYLCDGVNRVFLCKRRNYYHVGRYFEKDLPVKAIHNHKWGHNKMLDALMELLPKRIAEAERWEMAYA